MDESVSSLVFYVNGAKVNNNNIAVWFHNSWPNQQPRNVMSIT
jgi:hypothetical protein